MCVGALELQTIDQKRILNPLIVQTPSQLPSTICPESHLRQSERKWRGLVWHAKVGSELWHRLFSHHYACPEVNQTRYGAQMDRKDAPKMLDCVYFRVVVVVVVVESSRRDGMDTGTHGIN